MSVLSSTLEFDNGDVIFGDMVDFGEDDFLMNDFFWKSDNDDFSFAMSTPILSCDSFMIFQPVQFALDFI